MSSLDGVNAMIENVMEIAREWPDKTGAALYAEALVETKESMARTPVLTGALRASHVTNEPVIDGADISVKIEVGGPAAPYAWDVHEDVERYHRNGQAKFLESTVVESAPFMLERVSKRLQLEK